MAFTGMAARRNGWRLQAEHLVAIHSVAGIAATVVTEHVRRSTAQKQPIRLEENDLEIANELERLRAKLAERDAALARAEERTAFLTRRVSQLERQVAREAAVARMLSEQLETLAENAAAVAEPAAEPDDEFSATRDELVLLENANHSLQMSLDLVISENSRLSDCLTATDSAVERESSEFARMKTALDWFVSENTRLSGCLAGADSAIDKSRAELARMKTERDRFESENSRLSQRLAESDAAFDKARSRLEQMKTAVTVLDAERNRLSGAADAAKTNHQAESKMLSIRLAAMSARAVTAEKLLAKAVKRLLMRIEETRVAERDFADARARKLIEEGLGPLHSTVQIKERRVQELEQSRSKLLESANTLLQALETRDTALARAESRIKLLGEMFGQLEATAKPADKEGEVESLNCQPQGACVTHKVTGLDVRKDRKKSQNKASKIRTKSPTDSTADVCSNRILGRSKALLAYTITF